MKKLELIIEKNDGLLWGRIEGKGNFSPNGSGVDTTEVITDIKDCIQDYQEHEGKEDEFWAKVKLNEMEFDLRYDLESFLEEFDFLNLSVIADRIKINRTLLNQYKTGSKHPSIAQARKIQTSIQQLAQKVVLAQII
jgi:hypothetical protein